MAEFTASTLTSFSTTTVKSTTLPSGVGTRTATPSIFPCKSGITTPIAFAAPVLVGIIFAAAPLPRVILIGESFRAVSTVL